MLQHMSRLFRRISWPPGRSQVGDIDADASTLGSGALGAAKTDAFPFDTQRVLWLAESMGYKNDLMYFEPILRGIARSLPGLLISVAEDFPTSRYPGLSLWPILRKNNFPVDAGPLISHKNVDYPRSEPLKQYGNQNQNWSW